MPGTTDPRVDNIFVDMYLGKGRDDPPMTIRLERLEAATAAMKMNSEQAAIDSKETRRFARNTFWAVLSAIVVAFISFKMGWVH
jgi:hypothetical protein